LGLPSRRRDENLRCCMILVFRIRFLHCLVGYRQCFRRCSFLFSSLLRRRDLGVVGLHAAGVGLGICRVVGLGRLVLERSHRR
jgi:hypothetical protein